MSTTQSNLNHLVERAAAAEQRGELDEASRLFQQASLHPSINLFPSLENRVLQALDRLSSRQRTSPGLPGALAPASPPPTTPRESEQARRVRDLEGEAESYIGQKSNESFKQAIAIFNRILDFDLPLAERRRIEQRLLETNQAREEFLGRFGQLITARAVENDAAELIEMRRLLTEQQVAVGPDNESLSDRISDVSKRFAEKLRRLAGEEATLGAQAREDGVEFLDLQKLNAAAGRYARAAQILDEPVFRPAAEPATASERESVKQAISYLTEQFRARAEVAGDIAGYRRKQAEVETLLRRVADQAARYHEAEQCFYDGDYPGAVKRLMFIQGMLDEDRSKQVERLLKLARDMWAQQARPRVEWLIAQAESLLNMGDLEGARREIEAAADVTAGLEGTAFEGLRTEATRLNQQIIRKRGELDGQIRQLKNHAPRTREEFDRAMALVEQLLTSQPGYGEALSLREQLILGRATLADHEAASAQQTEDAERMRRARADLDSQIAALKAHNDQLRARSLRSTLVRTRDKLDERLAAVLKVHGERERVVQRLDAIEQQLRQGLDRHEAELEALAQIRRGPAVDAELRARCDELEHRIRADSASRLWDEVRDRLNLPPDQADPESALERLARLTPLVGPDEEPDLRWYERRARRIISRRDGLRAYREGRFDDAFELLRGARDDSDPDLLSALHEVALRRAEGRLKTRQIEEARAALAECDLTDPVVARLSREIQLAGYVATVSQLIAAYRLDDAEAELAQAASAAQALDPELREQLAAARARLRAAEQAEESARTRFASFEQTRQRADLRAAVALLDAAINGMPQGDLLRRRLLDLRERYNTVQADEDSQELQARLAEARRQMQVRAYGEALAILRQAAPLAQGRDRSEIDRLIGETRAGIDFERRQIAEEARSTLGRHDLRARTVAALLERVRAAQTWDESGDPRLATAEQDLLEASGLLTEVERKIEAAVALWAALHARANSPAPAEEALRQARDRMDDRRYGHLHLHPDQSGNLLRRVSESRSIFEQARELHRTLGVLIAQEPVPSDRYADGFRQLASHEQTLADAIRRLADEGFSVPRPQGAESAPLQHSALAELVRLHNKLIAKSHDTLDQAQLVHTLRTAQTLRSLLERLDPEGKLGLHQQLQSQR